MLQATCPRDGLLAAAVQASGAIGSTSSIPIVSALLLKCENDAITVTGTNMDLWSSGRAECEGLGAVAIPADLLIPALRNLPEGSEVTLAQDMSVKLSAGRTSFDLPALPADDFPSLNEQYAFAAEMDAVGLANVLQRTSYAVMVMGNANFTAALSGVCLKPHEGGLRALAGHGSHLAIAWTVADGLAEMPSLLLSPKTAQELIRLCKAADVVKLEASENLIRATTAKGSLVARLVDATFPQVERVIPENQPIIVEAGKRDLISLLNAALVVARDDRDRSIRVRFEPGSVSVVARNMNAVRAMSEVEADYAGEPLELSIHGTRWLDALRLIGVERVRLSLTDGSSPVRLEGVNEPGMLVVQMPLRG